MPCPECLKPCPEHGILRCATCHKHDGECDLGDCQSIATHLVNQPREVRRFCEFHATAPQFGFARTGATVKEL